MQPLNTQTSIVDLLKSKGMDSSYSNRASLWQKYGSGQYTGSAEQNTALIGNIANESVPMRQSTTSVNKLDRENSAKLDTAIGMLNVQGANGLSSQQTTNTQNNGTQSTQTVDPVIAESRKNTVWSLYNQGVTDPTRILNQVNYDQNGNMVGDFTIDEVQKLVKTNPAYQPSDYDKFTEEQQKILKGFDEQQKTYNDTLEQIRQRADTTNQALIDQIKKTFEARRAKMVDMNSRVLGSKSTAGNESGMSMYNSDVQKNILTDEEIEGERRLTELDAQELQLIVQAEQARKKEDYEMLNDSMQMYEKINTEKSAVLNKLLTASINERKRIDELNKTQSTLDSKKLNTAVDYIQSAAPEIAKTLSLYESDKDKESYITALANRLGVSTEIVKGELSRQNIKDAKLQADLNKKLSPSTTKKTSQSGANSVAKRGDSVQQVLNSLVQYKNQKNFAEIGTNLYDDYVGQLRAEYGQVAVNELNKAIKAMNLTVEGRKL